MNKKERTTVYTDKEIYRKVRVKLLQENRGSFVTWLDKQMREFIGEQEVR